MRTSEYRQVEGLSSRVPIVKITLFPTNPWETLTIFTSEQLTKLNQKTLDTLVKCKAIRESLGGENGHEIQCKKGPENVNEKQYFYQRECYEKFTYAKTLRKRKLNKTEETDESRNKTRRLQKRLLRLPSRSKSAQTGHLCTMAQAGVDPGIFVCRSKFPGRKVGRGS